VNLTLAETVRDLLEPFEKAQAAGSDLTFPLYLVDLWVEALTDALESAQVIEAGFIALMTSEGGESPYERALERQRKHQEAKAETFVDPYDANIIVLPNAALPAEVAFS